jgi:hypothetical protein
MMFIKKVSAIGDWVAYHIAKGSGNADYLNAPSTFNKSQFFNSTNPTSDSFTLSSDTLVNGSGITYVAYLFAHDPLGESGDGSDGMIACGDFTGVGASQGINLGWEPQLIVARRVDTGGDNGWQIFDSLRGFDKALAANVNSAENSRTLVGSDYQLFQPTATGFETQQSGFSAFWGGWIYMAIRAPMMKEPTAGTEVYNAIARTGTSAAGVKVTGVGFTPDLSIISLRAGSTGEKGFIHDRMRGTGDNKYIRTTHTASEGDSSYLTFVESLDMDGHSLGNDNQYGTRQYYNYAGFTYIDHFFKRAKGFFDVVAYTGTGVARTVDHNLGVVPEMMIVKNRTTAEPWITYHIDKGNDYFTKLNENQQSWNDSAGNYWNLTTPVSTMFSVGVSTTTNGNTHGMIAYLFATLDGVSKVGSYTGNGSNQNIACGFSAGARFVLIKRTDADGDWYTWDTTRGIIAGNDPHISLNTSAAEVTTDDSIDPQSAGFTVNQVSATNINVTSATYIFLAIA